MKAPLVHGCYDSETLTTLREIGIQQFGFDLRGRSPHLVQYHVLKDLIKSLPSEKVRLIFENDKATTILSFLDLLKGEASEFSLEFRDQLTADFYDSFNVPFYWMFSPSRDWENVLFAKNLKGLLLPLDHQIFYQEKKVFWEIVERRNLEIHLHATNFQEALELQKDENLQISLDLSRDIEKGFRVVDQVRLKKEMSEIFNESSTF